MHGPTCIFWADLTPCSLKDFPNPFGKSNMGKNTAIQDVVKVPNVPPGEYVVGFRWDCGAED
jgi:hypothetical protein